MMIKVSRYISFFLILLLYSCLEDTFEPFYFGSLSGYVYDNFNDQPLRGVEINTNPSSSVVFSDSTGYFEIEEIASGEYSFTANINGYEKEFINASIINGVTTEITFKLERQVITPEEATNPDPTSETEGTARDLALKWTSTVPKNDSLTFDVFVYESNIDSIAFSKINTKDTFFILNELRYETTYYWQVNTISSTGGKSNGVIWSFTTLDFPDNRYLYSSGYTGNYQVYSTNANNEQRIQITRTPYNSLYPLYNSSRSEIAFVSNASLDNQIYLMDFKGNSKRRITQLPIAGYHNNGMGFSWWPDNGGFIYPHYNKLFSIDRNGSNLVEIATAPVDRHFIHCDYESSGQRIVVLTSGSLIYEGEILIMQADGSNIIQVVPDYPGIIQYPSFSIDGKFLMYTRDVSGFESEDGRQLDSRIYLLNLDTMETTDLSINKPDGTNDLQPRFSPFGTEIIFMNVMNDGSGTKTVYSVDLNGSERTILFENAEMPYWK